MEYYWTKTPEDNPVYHWNPSCEEGRKIESTNIDGGSEIPVGRAACKVC